MGDTIHTDITISPDRTGRSIRQAMVLAAGLGERMKPITETRPKPLVEIAGKPIIEHILDHLQIAGIETVVVNTFYLADMLEGHLAKRNGLKIIVSREDERLETGGGVLKAIEHFGDDPFFVINGDSFILDGPVPSFDRLERTWDDEKMDALLLLHSTIAAHGYDGKGDFVVEPDGSLTRRPEQEITPYAFTGTQILHPRLFTKEARDGVFGHVFSLNKLYDRALEDGRLYGMIHDGEWFHIGTPAALAEIEEFMDDPYPGAEYRSS